MPTDETLDCHRLPCPMPVIPVQDRVAELAPGDTVTAVRTDPGAVQDLPAWCRITGHELVATETRDDGYVISLCVAKR